RTFHAFRAVKSGRLARWPHRRTAAVFAVSGQIEARCRDVGVPAERVFRVPGVADLPRFAGAADPQPIRDELKLGPSPVTGAAAGAGGARAVGALPDTVVHGGTGLLVEDARPESVMAALAAILADPARARAMGLAGRRRAERDFVPERAVAMVEQVYRSLP